MRCLTFAFVILISQVLYAEEIPGIGEFSEQYWSAIRSKDPQKIFALFDSRVFEQLTPEESEFLKKTWMRGYVNNAEQQGDSYKIATKSFPREGDPLPEWRWAAKPEYQIEIQTFKKVENGTEGLTLILDLAIQRDGRFYIIRPVPPVEKLERQMKRENGN